MCETIVDALNDIGESMGDFLEHIVNTCNPLLWLAEFFQEAFDILAG
jgi:GTP1/Obg family GTP-binding protein